MTATLAPSTQELENDLITCAVCRSAGLPDIEAHYEPAIVELAHRRYRNIGLQELVLSAAQANGYTGRHFKTDVVQTLKAAFSTTNLSGILSNIANKFLLQGFNNVESAWRDITAMRSVKDFKPVESYRLAGNDTYKKVAPGGELTHGVLTDEKFTNRAETYGRMLSISRQDLINDDLGALTTPAKLLGRGAALALNEVFWTTFLANNDFFTDANGNLFSGADTALSIDGLTKAEIKFLEKTDTEGKPLGLLPAILLVPPSLSVTATQLMSSLEIRGGEGTYPVANPHTAKFRVVRSAYLNNGKIPGGSGKAWYLLANPQDAATIEVAFLNGNETPTIESADANFQQLGIQLRGFHDFGISMQEKRAGVRMNGE